MLNLDRLAELLGYLYDLRGLRCSLHQPGGKEIFTSMARSDFCNLIGSGTGGHARCLACDQDAIKTAIKLQAPFRYRCHAGAIDSAIPVLINGQAAYVILFGQILDDSPLDAQWEQARQGLAWYPDQQALYQAFSRLPRMSQREIKACYELVNACVSETRMPLLADLQAMDNYKKLDIYIANHYAQPLSVGSIAQALNTSVSRLCALAASHKPGLTVMKLVCRHRMAAARSLLSGSEVSIREVASRVGIPDYNYFTKVFKKETGQTPSAWRRHIKALQSADKSTSF